MRTMIVVAAMAAVPSLAQQQSPPVADAIVDLRTDEGAATVKAVWRFAEAHVTDAESFRAGPDRRPAGDPVLTNDIHPRYGTPEFEAAPWATIAASTLEARRTAGRLAFAWYTVDFSVPERVGNVSTEGATIVLETTVDDYAEVWVDGATPVLGQSGGLAIRGWNTPTRTVLTRSARPGQRLRAAVFAANGPMGAPPANYIWMRSATLDIYKPGRGLGQERVKTEITRLDPALDAIIAPGTQAERLAGGFVFTEGPVWVPESADGRYGGGGRGGYLLFSDPNQNVIHRYDPRTGETSIFRTKSGYSGPDAGDYFQPGSNGLALDREGRLTICEHGNRRITRLEPNGTVTVLADRYQGKRLNSPNDLVYRSDGTLFFSDPPFGLPKTFADPRKELPISGVYSLKDGELRLAAADLAAPNGLAFSPDERVLYVDNWEESRKVILRYEVAPDGSLSSPSVFFDMTSTPGEICLDGLKVDRRGNLFVAGPRGLWIISPAGQHLGTVVLPELPANFAIGEQGELYICARSGLYRLSLLAAR